MEFTECTLDLSRYSGAAGAAAAIKEAFHSSDTVRIECKGGSPFVADETLMIEGPENSEGKTLIWCSAFCCAPIEVAKGVEFVVGPGGFVFGAGDAIAGNIIEGGFSVDGGVIAAWEADAGITVYISGSAVDLKVEPAGKAVWGTGPDGAGICYALGEEEGAGMGFFPINGITVIDRPEGDEDIDVVDLALYEGSVARIRAAIVAALAEIPEDGIVYVANSGEEAFQAGAETLEFSVPDGKGIEWCGMYVGSAAGALITVTFDGAGIFEVTADEDETGAVINGNKASGQAVRIFGSDAGVIVSGGLLIAAGIGDTLYTDGEVSVESGKVMAAGDGDAVRASGNVSVSGGTVAAKAGLAINTEANANVFGGFVFAYGSDVTGAAGTGDVINAGGLYTGPGDGVVVAWEKTGSGIYLEETDDDLYTDPVGAAEWVIDDGYGIWYVNDEILTNYGFFEVEGVTVILRPGDRAVVDLENYPTAEAAQIAIAAALALPGNRPVTIVKSGETPFQAGGVPLNIDFSGKTVNWAAAYTGEMDGDDGLIALYGDGGVFNLMSFEVPCDDEGGGHSIVSTGSVINRGSGDAIRASGKGAEIRITAGIAAAGAGKAVSAAGDKSSVHVTGGFVFADGVVSEGGFRDVIACGNILINDGGGDGIVASRDPRTDIYGEGSYESLHGVPGEATLVWHTDIVGTDEASGVNFTNGPGNRGFYGIGTVTILGDPGDTVDLASFDTVDLARAAAAAAFAAGHEPVHIINSGGAFSTGGRPFGLYVPEGNTLVWQTVYSGVAEGGALIEVTGGGDFVIGPGGFVFGYGDSVADNAISGDFMTNGGVVVVWDPPGGTVIYMEGAEDGLITAPAGAAAWGIGPGDAVFGVNYAAGDAAPIFFAVEGVTVIPGADVDTGEEGSSVGAMVDLKNYTSVGTAELAITHALAPEENSYVTVIKSNPGAFMAGGQALRIHIDADKTVVWEAEYLGSVEKGALIEVTGSGKLEINSYDGSVVNAGYGAAVSAEGSVVVSGGFIFAYGVCDGNGGSVIKAANLGFDRSGNGVVVAWDRKRGGPVSDGSVTGLTALPAGAVARWVMDGTDAGGTGISYANAGANPSNYGVLPVGDVKFVTDIVDLCGIGSAEEAGAAAEEAFTEHDTVYIISTGGPESAIYTAGGGLKLTVEAGRTLVWGAPLFGELDRGALIEVGGAGTFKVSSGRTASRTPGLDLDGFVVNDGGGDAIAAEGDVVIDGATVRAWDGVAVRSRAGVNISGGFVFACGVDVEGRGNVIDCAGGLTFSDEWGGPGCGVVVAWDKAEAGPYRKGAGTGLTAAPSGSVAQWVRDDAGTGETGIRYERAEIQPNSGFLPIAGAVVILDKVDLAGYRAGDAYPTAAEAVAAAKAAIDIMLSLYDDVSVVCSGGGFDAGGAVLNFVIGKGKSLKWNAVYSGETDTGALIEVSGPGVFRIAAGSSVKNRGAGNAVSSGGTNAVVYVDGGMVLAREGYAIRVTGKGGFVNISGGFVFAFGAGTDDVVISNKGKAVVNGTLLCDGTQGGSENYGNAGMGPGDGIVIALDKALAQEPIYVGDVVGITAAPGAAKASWGKSGKANGILYMIGKNKGFHNVPDKVVSPKIVGMTRAIKERLTQGKDADKDAAGVAEVAGVAAGYPAGVAGVAAGYPAGVAGGDSVNTFAGYPAEVAFGAAANAAAGDPAGVAYNAIAGGQADGAAGVVAGDPAGVAYNAIAGGQAGEAAGAFAGYPAGVADNVAAGYPAGVAYNAVAGGQAGDAAGAIAGDSAGVAVSAINGGQADGAAGAVAGDPAGVAVSSITGGSASDAAGAVAGDTIKATATARATARDAARAMARDAAKAAARDTAKATARGATKATARNAEKKATGDAADAAGDTKNE